MSVQTSPFTSRNGADPSSGSALKDAAAGFERLGALVAVGYGKPETRAVAERGFDHVA